MSTIYGTIVGMNMLVEPIDGDTDSGHGVLIEFTMPAYSASSDSGSLGHTVTLATLIANERRDGRAVTLIDACHARAGLQGTTQFRTGTWAVSSGNLTFNLNDTSDSEVDAASGVTTRPLAVFVAYALAAGP